MMEKKKIGLFAGTTEGRILAERLAEGLKEGLEKRPEERLDKKSVGAQISLDIFVATEYGKKGLPRAENINVFYGRMDGEQITAKVKERSYDLVLDATHPYARLVSEHVKRACEHAGIRYVRVLREPGPESTDGVILVDSVESAISVLKDNEGAVLVTTGSKELYKYKELPQWQERVYARVLSLPEAVSQAAELGFCGSHLIAMQGPFSVEMNLALLKSVDAKWMVTKESGKAGGFEEKAEAARQAGAGLIVIGRPEEDGISLQEALDMLERDPGLTSCREKSRKPGEPEGTGELPSSGWPEKSGEPGMTGKPGEPQKLRKVYLLGAGPGGSGLLTREAVEALTACDLIAGAKRIVEGLGEFGKAEFLEYQPERILEYLRAHEEYGKVCIALSGDAGFYSGARKLMRAFEKEPDTELSVLPGISTVNYFFARIGESWEDVRFLSLHGRETDFIPEVKMYPKVFLLGGGSDTLKDICGRLLDVGLSGVTLTVGENLSLPGERIRTGNPEMFKDCETESLAVFLIKNPKAEPWRERVLTYGLHDEDFLRDKVPMTKMEVRAVSLSKLKLTAGAVVYDVGAGTGSVSVECARLSGTIKVFAMERNHDAVELIRKNREKFGLSNLEIVEGEAPKAMAGLPAPTHVFIGGSGGSMADIIRAALSMNPEARFVANVITLESMAALTEVLKTEQVEEEEIVQLSAARAKKAGESHLMMGQNPVWIVSFTGTKKEPLKEADHGGTEEL